MKKYNLMINLILVTAVLFGMAFKCGTDRPKSTNKSPRSNKSSVNQSGNQNSSSANDAYDDEESDNTDDDPPITDEPQNPTAVNDGQKLEGTYVAATYNSFRRFVFSADGTIKRGAAASGGNYAAGNGDAGTYSIDGARLIINFDNGTTETHKIDAADEPSPTIIFIDGERFTLQ